MISIIERIQIKSPTFLSEYQPHKSADNAAIAPPGVDRMRVCLDLPKGEQSLAMMIMSVALRVSEILDDNVTDY